jgi:hypothetical protein
VCAETEVAIVAGLAAIRADEEDAVENELHWSISFRSVDVRIPAVGAVGRLRIKKCQLHFLSSQDCQISATVADCLV